MFSVVSCGVCDNEIKGKGFSFMCSLQNWMHISCTCEKFVEESELFFQYYRYAGDIVVVDELDGLIEYEFCVFWKMN